MKILPIFITNYGTRPVSNFHISLLYSSMVRSDVTSAVGRVKDGCLSPPRLVPVSLIHSVRLGIGTEVLEDKVGISVAALGI